MNRMNIPPPFEELEEKYPIIKEIYDAANCNDLFDFSEPPLPLEEPGRWIYLNIEFYIMAVLLLRFIF